MSALENKNGRNISEIVGCATSIVINDVKRAEAQEEHASQKIPLLP
jgi:hypothetical protein